MSYWYTVLALAGINVILAYSVYASFMSGQVSIGQVAFFGIGAYVGASMTVLAGTDLAVALAVAGAAAAVLSLGLGIPTLRLKGYHFTIATVAFAEAVRVLLHNAKFGRPTGSKLAGDQWLGPDGPTGFRHISYLKDHGITSGEFALVVWGLVLAVIAVFLVVERSRIARILRTIEEDEVVARAIGIPVARYKVVAFAFGGLLAGVAGALHAHLLTFISGNDFIIHASTIALAFVVIGGGQTMWGPLVGATIFTILPETLRPIKDFRIEMFGLLIILVMLFRPAGIISGAMVRAWSARLSHMARGRRSQAAAAVAVDTEPAGGDEWRRASSKA